MKKLILLLTFAFVCGCSSLPKQYSTSPDKSLIQGESSRGLTVLIRCIDDGEILWVKGYHLGNKAWVEPGLHKVSVSCTTTTSWGSRIASTDVQVNAEPGYNYLLNATASTNAMGKPIVEVTKVLKK